MTDRDTKYLAFANLLAKELLEWEVESMAEYKTRIARRAYDLACHVFYETRYGNNQMHIEDLPDPDFTTWPKNS